MDDLGQRGKNCWEDGGNQLTGLLLWKWRLSGYSRVALSDTVLTETGQLNALMVCKWRQGPTFRLSALLAEETTFLEHDIVDVLWAYGCPKNKIPLNTGQLAIRKNMNLLPWIVR